MPVADPLRTSVVRYVSRLGAHAGNIAFGVVLEARDGAPTAVANLNAVASGLGSTFESFLASDGFALAARVRGRPDRAVIETIEPSELPERLHAPVDVPQAALDRGEKVIVAVGFNYDCHVEEHEPAIDLPVFPKPVEPTGPFAPLAWPSHPGGEAVLLDYEAELAFVVLRDLDLDHLPASADDLLANVAFFAANDVTDRWDQIVRGHLAYTRAKSGPGFLPSGPWMVHGSELFPKTRSSGHDDLRIRLRVGEPDGRGAGSWRQDESTAAMIHDPLTILRRISELRHESSQVDRAGRTRDVYAKIAGRAVLPSGSVVLTGTPAGSAVKPPRGWARASLIVRAGFSMRRARLAFARKSARQRRDLGYLEPGQTVETSMGLLGTQRFTIVG